MWLPVLEPTKPFILRGAKYLYFGSNEGCQIRIPYKKYQIEKIYIYEDLKISKVFSTMYFLYSTILNKSTNPPPLKI